MKAFAAKTTKGRKLEAADEHIARVRRICARFSGTTERLSHGEPTWFVAKKTFAMFDNNHHNDGHIAVWLPVEPGIQATLLKTAPDKFFMPPYVGVRGWVGIALERVDDEELSEYLARAWQLIAPKRLQESTRTR
jgi:hypothetical protein